MPPLRRATRRQNASFFPVITYSERRLLMYAFLRRQAETKGFAFDCVACLICSLTALLHLLPHVPLRRWLQDRLGGSLPWYLAREVNATVDLSSMLTPCLRLRCKASATGF